MKSKVNSLLLKWFGKQALLMMVIFLDHFTTIDVRSVSVKRTPQEVLLIKLEKCIIIQINDI